MSSNPISEITIHFGHEGEYFLQIKLEETEAGFVTSSSCNNELETLSELAEVAHAITSRYEAIKAEILRHELDDDVNQLLVDNHIVDDPEVLQYTRAIELEGMRTLTVHFNRTSSETTLASSTLTDQGLNQLASTDVATYREYCDKELMAWELTRSKAVDGSHPAADFLVDEILDKAQIFCNCI